MECLGTMLGGRSFRISEQPRYSPTLTWKWTNPCAESKIVLQGSIFHINNASEHTIHTYGPLAEAVASSGLALARAAGPLVGAEREELKSCPPFLAPGRTTTGHLPHLE